MRSITDVAAELDVTVRTLRFYEQQGLVAPARKGRIGARMYDDAAIARVKECLRYARYGFTLREIRDGIDRQKLIQRFKEMPAEIQERIAARRELERELDAMEDGSYG